MVMPDSACCLLSTETATKYLHCTRAMQHGYSPVLMVTPLVVHLMMNALSHALVSLGHATA